MSLLRRSVLRAMSFVVFMAFNSHPASAEDFYDFSAGRNAEQQDCKGLWLFNDKDNQVTPDKVQLFCGAWEIPSAEFETKLRSDAEAMLQGEQCREKQNLEASQNDVTSFTVSCPGSSSSNGVYGGRSKVRFMATHGDKAIVSMIFPGDFKPAVESANAMLTGHSNRLTSPPNAFASNGGSDEPAIKSCSSLDDPKAQNVQSVGLCASVNYEVLRNLAFTENAFWNFDAAERDFRKLLQMHEWVAPHDRIDEAEILLEIGLNLSSSERVEEANGFFAQSDAVLASLNQDNGIAQQYNFLHTKSIIYRAVGALERKKWTEAINLIHSLANIQDNKSTIQTPRSDDKDDQAVVLNWTPSQASRITIAATSQASQRLILSTSSADASSAQQILQAQKFYVLATAHRHLGLSDQARTELTEAETALALAESPPTWLVAMIEREKADTYFDENKPQDAEAHILKAIKVLNASAPKSRLLGHMLLRHADIAEKLNRTDDAIGLGNNAIKILTEQTSAPGFPPDLVAHQLARLLAAIRRSKELKSPTQQLKDEQEEYFTTLALAWTGPAARSAIQLAARLESNDTSKVIRNYQDAERAYVQAAAQAARFRSLCGPQSEAPKIDTKSPAQTGNTSKCAKEDVSPILIKKLEAVEDAAEIKKNSLKKDVQKYHREYLELLSPKANLKDLQKALSARDDEAYIRFVPTRDATFGILVKHDDAIPFSIELGQSSLEGRIDRIRQTLRYIRYRSGLRDYPVKDAHDLFKILFKEVEPQLLNVRRLHIDPNGALADLSFAALVVSAPDDLVMKQTEVNDYRRVDWMANNYLLDIALGPAAFNKLKAARQKLQPSTGGLLAFGDFVPNPRQVALALSAGRSGNQTNCERKIADALATYRALKGTGVEAKAALEAFGENSQSIVGPEFTDLAFKSLPQVRQASILLFATHGVVGLSDCFTEPALLTSYAPNGHGLLAASEILDVPLQARVVILSACDTTAGGKIDRSSSGFAEGASTGGGERLSGLVRSFIYAGSQSVIATLWEADVNTSKLLTSSVIKQLKAGRRLDETLQESQKLIISDNNGTGSHPYYWASFIPVGEISDNADPKP